MTCRHTNTEKAMIIPTTKDGKLDYEQMSNNLDRIIAHQPGFKWREVLVCLDCNTVLENNLVFNPNENIGTIKPDCFACLNRDEKDDSCFLQLKIVDGKCEGFC